MTRHSPLQFGLVDTGYLIAAERNPPAAIAHLKAMSIAQQVLLVIPAVYVESVGRSRSTGSLVPILSRLRRESETEADGLRAAELLQAVTRADPALGVAISVVDALVAAVGDRFHAIVYTDDPAHLDALQAAGARIAVQRVPF